VLTAGRPKAAPRRAAASVRTLQAPRQAPRKRHGRRQEVQATGLGYSLNYSKVNRLMAGKDLLSFILSIYVNYDL